MTKLPPISTNDRTAPSKPEAVAPQPPKPWTFVCTEKVSPLDRLQYINQIQAFLQSECLTAKIRFDGASKRAQDAISADFADRLKRLNQRDGAPQFQDLSELEQQNARMFFLTAAIPDKATFLDNCITDGFRNDFSLTIYVSRNIGPVPLRLPSIVR